MQSLKDPAYSFEEKGNANFFPDQTLRVSKAAVCSQKIGVALLTFQFMFACPYERFSLLFHSTFPPLSAMQKSKLIKCISISDKGLWFFYVKLVWAFLQTTFLWANSWLHNHQ